MAILNMFVTLNRSCARFPEFGTRGTASDASSSLQKGNC
jgi:hypothetical protein